MQSTGLEAAAGGDELRRLLVRAAETEIPSAVLAGRERFAKRFWTAVRTESEIEESIAEKAAASKARPTTPAIRTRRWASGIWAGIAGVLLLAMGGGVLLNNRDSAPEGSTQIFQTADGQQSIVRLSRDISMRLAPATTVRASGDVVTVQGEAYFEVTPNMSRPFSVKTGNAEIRVLGTAFSVRQYHVDEESRVVVERGKVAVLPLHASASGQARAVLAANMLGRVIDSSVTVTSGISADAYMGWIRGKLVFQEIPLSQVIAELVRAYGMDIRLADTALSNRPMTLRVAVDRQPLTQVLDLIGIATNAHYMRQGDGFVLVPGRVARRELQRKRLPLPERSYGK